MQMIHIQTNLNNTLIYIQWKKITQKNRKTHERKKLWKKKATKLVTELTLRNKHFSNETQKKKHETKF